VQGSDSGGRKRSKSELITDQATAEQFEDDAKSLASDDQDAALLWETVVDDCEAALRSSSVFSDSGLPPSKGKRRAVDDDTDFVAGDLHLEGIKFLQPPKDTTTTSTKALMRLFRDALSIQEKTPLSKLGWYIDGDLVTNMYQWIVELHSFPSHLPLARDMKVVGLTSIVLEIRYPSGFPFSPPFIRIVKPRFLPFNLGGGGNVTEGGAMCMEVLTNSGWTAGQSFENLLLQVRMAICDEERPARLMLSQGLGDKMATYGVGEAVQAYIRACHNHGWTVPEGFEKFQHE
jgi:ubiquitin-conjugating enzyme E2 Q